jgi:aminoglycoside 3-N-acetyltransferase
MNFHQIKGFLKKKNKEAKVFYARTFRCFDREDLHRSFEKLGIVVGDVLFFHSSYNHFVGFDGKPSDVIAALQAAVGDTGSLMAPTLSFDGLAVAYAESKAVFDVRRSPSKTGLLTELLRRSPNVVRSVHPTHSVVVSGRRAERLAAEHYQAKTPCGRSSPYFRLLDENAKILLLGCDIEPLTFFHTIEEELEPQMPFSPFTETVYLLTSKTADGGFVETRTRLFKPEISRRRNLRALRSELERMGAWREASLPGVPIFLLTARDAMTAASALASRGVFCYDEN